MRVAPRRNVLGSITVSRPISTSASISVLAGSTIVTPARPCSRWMRACAERADVGEVDAVVDAERERRVGDGVGADELAVGAQERQHVGQVELALGVVGGEAAERVEQVAARERVDAGVDLADRLLLGRRVAGRLRLDHALDAAVGGADHAPVAGRVLELHRRHRRRGAALLVRLRERGDRLGGDQRHVAVEHEHGVAVADVVGGGAHRVAGPVGLLLHRHLDAVGELTGEPAARPVDDHDPARTRLLCGPDRPADHRAPADRVQDLRRLGLHARALARGEDQHGGSGHAEHRSIGSALGGGLMARHRFLVPADGGSIPPPQLATRRRCRATSSAPPRSPRRRRRPRRTGARSSRRRRPGRSCARRSGTGRRRCGCRGTPASSSR